LLGNFISWRELTLSPDSGRRVLTPVTPAGRVPAAAIAVVMAERAAMAVILIVEDDVFVRQIAELMIDDLGHTTLSAFDLGDALSVLRSPQHIDALFTDIRLKTAVLGGCELANQAVKVWPTLRVLYTTGNSITDKMKALFVEGAHFLPKPYTQDQLQDAVEKLLTA
jgi:CheY-like chemotaxis protein